MCIRILYTADCTTYKCEFIFSFNIQSIKNPRRHDGCDQYHCNEYVDRIPTSHIGTAHAQIQSVTCSARAYVRNQRWYVRCHRPRLGLAV